MKKLTPKRKVLKKRPWAYSYKTPRGWHIFGIGQIGQIDYYTTAHSAWKDAEKSLRPEV